MTAVTAIAAIAAIVARANHLERRAAANIAARKGADAKTLKKLDREADKISRKLNDTRLIGFGSPALFVYLEIDFTIHDRSKGGGKYLHPPDITLDEPRTGLAEKEVTVGLGTIPG